MPLDHFVSQVHLKNFYAADLGQRMHAMRKSDLSRYPCDAYSQCRILDGSTNPYFQEPRVIEEFLKSVEPVYNSAVEKARAGKLDAEAIYAIAGFAAFVEGCSPAGMRIHTAPLQAIVQATAEILDRNGKIPKAPEALGNKSITQLLQDGDVKIAIDPKYPQSFGIANILKSTALWGNSVWDILVNDDAGSPFFTSDYPLAIEPTERAGFVNRLLPLTPNLAIRIRPDMSQHDTMDLSFQRLRVRRVQVTRQEVIHMNRMFVQCAESVVYFSADLPWIPDFIAKNRHFRIETDVLRIPAERGTMSLSTLKIAEYRG